jgi:hypothetical protein
MALRVVADQQRRFDTRQPGEQMREPEVGAFAARWQIAAAAATGIAVTHRNDRHPRWIVKRLPIHGHPCAKALAARVVPGNPGFMHAASRRLPHDENARRFVGLKHRTCAERQMHVTGATAANGDEQSVERGPALVAGVHCGYDRIRSGG